MSEPVVVPQTPPLSRLANVEIMHTGTWQLSTGPATFTTDDLTDAVASLGCGAVRRPILKLGHSDPRFDGEPCVGYVDRLAVADNGYTLAGDFAGMPGWLGDVLASAYPDRSVEGEYDYVCQMGHTHPFVVHAVALLGVTRPGIGTLESLQDIASLYGVVAARSRTGTPVVVRGSSVSPSSRLVAASVTAEDVMRAFYDSPLGSGWDSWVEELQLDPLQLIYVNDSDSSRQRVPVVIGPGEGVETVSFGTPVGVFIRYVDAAAGLPGRDAVKFGYRARPDRVAAAVPREGSVDLTDEQLATMRTTLGLPTDADPAAVTAAMIEKLTTSPAPEPVPPPVVLPEGTVAIDKVQLDELVAAATRGAQARTQQEHDGREALVSAAVRDGRIPPARREAWIKQLEADPGSETILASLAPGLIPVGPEIGHSGSATSADDELYAKLFGVPAGGNS